MIIRQFSFSFSDLIVLMGVVQGLAMAVILQFSTPKAVSKQLFSLILLVLSLLSFKILLHTLGLWELPGFRYFPLAIDTTLAPLFYWYICSVTAKPISRKTIISWFLPTLFFMAYALLVYSLALGKPTISLKDDLMKRLLFNQVKNAEDAVAVVSAIIFWFLGYRRLRWYRRWLYSTQSDTRLPELTWLRNLLVSTGILVPALTAVVLADDLFQVHDFLHLQLFYIYLTVLTYYLALKGYAVHYLYRPGSVIAAPELPAATEVRSDQHAVKNSIVCALEKDRLFLNPELTIKDLAQHIGYPQGAVSAAINGQFKQNFRSLVNGYRVEEVKRLLNKPPGHLSLLGIALESGFNSEASFYRIFRQETGLSPNEYLRQIRN